MNPTDPALLTLVVAAAAGLVIGLAAVIAGMRSLRRALAADAKVTLIGAAVVALAAGTLTISFTSLWHLTGTPWLGLFVDLAVVVLMALQLVGYRSLTLSLAQWVILAVSMWANSQAHQPPKDATAAVALAVAALGACQPLILKVALVGFKGLAAKYVGQEIVVERVPFPHWLHDPRGAYWITRQLALRTIPTYDAACRIEATVTRRALRSRATAERGHWWNRSLSPRQIALLDVLDEEATRGESRRRPPTAKPGPARSADTGAGATATARPAPAPSSPAPTTTAGGDSDWDTLLAAARVIQAASDRRLGRDAMWNALRAERDDDGNPKYRLAKPKAQALVNALDAEANPSDDATDSVIEPAPLLHVVGEGAP